MLTLILIGIIVLLSIAVFKLFHGKMVDLTKWHDLTRSELKKAQIDFAEFKAYVETHLHLHTAPPSAAPAANVSASKT